VWDPVNDSVLSELDGTGTVQAVYTNEPQQYGSVVSQRRGTTSHTLHADALGTTRILTTAAQAASDTYLYDAWGNEVASTGSTVNPFRWVGRYGYYADITTGLVYVRARMYQPTVARWLSLDPLSFTVDYNYGGISPAMSIDPSGLYQIDWPPEPSPNPGFCTTWQCLLLNSLLQAESVILIGPAVDRMADEARKFLLDRISVPNCDGNQDYRVTELPLIVYKQSVDFRSNVAPGFSKVFAAILGLRDPHNLDLAVGIARLDCVGKQKLVVDCCACEYEYTMEVNCQVYDKFDFKPGINRSPTYNNLAKLWQDFLKQKNINLSEPELFAYFSLSGDKSGHPHGCDVPTIIA